MTDPADARSAGVNAPAPAPVAEQGTPLSFEVLYRETFDDLFAYAATLLRDRTAAEDVVAASFERAYRRQASFDPRRGSQRQWLFGIARHAALDELRRRKRHAALAADPGSHEPALEDELADPIRRARVRAALAELDGRDRELVALKYFAGLDNAEIAGVLGISASNAGTRLSRAIHRLREACHERP